MCAAQQFRVQQQASPRAAFQHWATVGHVTLHCRSATKFTQFTRRDLCFHSQSLKSKNAVFHKLPSVTSPDKRFGSETHRAFILTFLLLCATKVRFIKLKSELDLCLALMGRPGFCSAAAVMENTVFMVCILWLTCEIPAFLKLLFFTSTTCPTGVYTMFFFLSVKSCVKNLCRNSHAITYRNLFFCLMIRILKIWVVSGWMRVECSPPFFSSCLSWIWGEEEQDAEETLTPKSSTFLGSDTRQTYHLIAHFLSSNVRKHSVEPDVQVVIMEQKVRADRYFWIIKEEIVCVTLVQLRTSVRAHPSGSLVFKQEIFVSLTYVEPHQSWHHPDFFPRVSRFPHAK